MPCLGVAGHGIFTMDRGTLQSNCHFSADGLLVCDQVARPVTCHPVTSDHKDSETESSGSFRKGKPSEAGNVELSRSSELGMLLDPLAEEELVLALCMLPGWSYVQQALRSSTPQTEASPEIIIEASSVQEQGVSASLLWGSNRLTSVSLKFLTLVNRQPNKEVKVLRIFTTNTQFCSADLHEAVVSPGSRLSIPIAYFVNSIGKAEGRILLQTNVGRYIVETLGEGIPFLYPLLGFMGASKSELWETVFFSNPSDESIIVDEAYIWMETSNEGSAPYQTKDGRGVLCKRYDSQPESSNTSRLKVRPKAEWFLAPHSSSPIMDLSIMVDNGKHLIGTLFFKIFRHSVQQFEVLVVPLEMEWNSLGTSNAKLLSKKNSVEVVAVFLETEKQIGWPRFLMNSHVLPVKVKNVSAKGQSRNRLFTISVENLLLCVQVKSRVADMCLTRCSGKSSLACRLSCLADFTSVKRLINSTTWQSVRDLCSALLFYGASRGADADEHKCSETLFAYVGDIFCHNRFDMPSAPCKTDPTTDDISNRKIVNGPKFIHAQDLDGTQMSWEYHAADLTEITKIGNIQGNEFSPLKKGFIVLRPFFLNSKSACAWPRIVVKSDTYARILDSSVSVVSRTWTGSNSRFCMGTLEQHDYRLSKDMESNILYILQESQKFSCIATYGIGLVDFANCGSEYSGLLFCCKKLLKFMDLLESDFLEESMAEDCFEACGARMKTILAVVFPPVCHVSLSFSKHQKLVLKLSLLILFSVFVMFIKVLRREKQLASDFRLRRHSCSHTFFFHSFCLKTGYIKASESSSNFEHAVERRNSASSPEYQKNQCHQNRFLVGTARMVASLGCVFRSFFDSQATVLNVRVQISESPRAVSAEQDLNYSKNSLLADQKHCNMVLNSVENPGNHQTSTTVREIQGISCRESTDTLRVTHLEVGTLPSVSLATTHTITEDVSPLSDLEKVQHTEKKEKGKRRKRRSNVIDLKQESERMGQSGSSSPPSSPASPATPLAYSSISPFLQSDSPARPLKGSTHSSGHSSNSFRDPTPRSTLVQFSSEMLSQLDVHTDHTCNSASKGRLHQVYTLASKASLEPLPTRRAAAAKTEYCGKGSVRTDTRKDASAGENWAAVARRAIATPSEEDQWQRLSSSSRCLKNGATRNKPVLLPSATFPQSGRSMQWKPQKLEDKSFTLNDPTSSPSLISTSLVAPNARAPGSRPANHCNEKPSVNNRQAAADGQLEVGSTNMCTDLRMHEGPKSEDLVYDIWGDHFAEISRRTPAELFSTDAIWEHDMVKTAFPKVGSLFAALTPGSADAAVGHSLSIPSADFSVFSCDTFFSPYQCRNAADSPKP